MSATTRDICIDHQRDAHPPAMDERMRSRLDREHVGEDRMDAVTRIRAEFAANLLRSHSQSLRDVDAMPESTDEQRRAKLARLMGTTPWVLGAMQQAADMLEQEA